MARRVFTALICVGLIVAVPAAAQADTGDIIEPQNDPQSAADGWQAGTCTEEPPESADFCSPESPEAQFFTQAGGHPPIGFTQYIIQHSEPVEGVIEPIKPPLAARSVKTLRVDLPPGLTVNPLATPERCPLADFLNQPEPGVFIPNCPAATQTGEEQANVVTNVPGVEFPPGSGEPLPEGFRLPLVPEVFKVKVFNLVPKPGEPALFGFVIAQKLPVFLETEVAWESDFHESFTIKLPAPTPGVSTLISRLVNFGEKGNGTFISNPTTCFDPEVEQALYSTWYRAESHEEPNPSFPAGSTPFEAPLPEGIAATGCDEVPFDPAIDVNPGTTAVDSPAAATVTTTMPFENPEAGGNPISQSHLRSARVTLPAGMGINPSAAAEGLVACTDAQFAKGQRVESNTCPAASRIGSVEIETPPLPKGSLKGDVYVGEQKSFDPASGEEFRILVEAKDLDEGIVVRLVGNVAADPGTGQLTAIFDEQEVGPLAGKLPRGLPQVPFESVKIGFDGSKSVLTSPPICAAAQTTSQMEPWARPGTHESPTSTFTLSTVPGGGTCPTTLAARSFVPTYDAVPNRTKAGGYSPLIVDIARQDGEQELKVVDVTLPKGLTGKLAGLEYCSEAALADAAAKSGVAVAGAPPCSDESFVGTAFTVAGSGPRPLVVAGNAYLAGPYKGAPLSLAIVTPAVAGPFDLGTVVIRVALNVDPRSAQVHAVSDVIPDVFGGVKLGIRAINLRLNRKRFMLNPTNCQPQASTGAISGGGANPANPAAFSSYGFMAPFRATECRKLGFKPTLHTRLTGPTQRAKNPRIRAVLDARKGDANIERTALVLPSSLFLDQSHIKDVCTRVQLAARDCPKSAIYGRAWARSPLLAKPLKGPVYLVSSNHTLPDLVADLRGQVNIRLYGVIGTKRGGLKTVFYNVPDVPVKRFVLNMRGGRKSLLVNSRNLCRQPQRAYLAMRAHNSRLHKVKGYRLNTASCKK
jgi:hypothetical protein